MQNLKDLLPAIIDFLDGKKTILVGLGLVANGLAAHDWTQVLQGLGLIFMRRAIAKQV
jgi:hypothetical protein